MTFIPAGSTLRLTTGSTATLSSVVSYADHDGTTVTPNAQFTAINSSTTTTICATPSTGARIVRSLTIRNTHASTSNLVVLDVFNGTTAFALYRVTLLAGESLNYVDGAGWSIINAQGLPRVAQSLGSTSAAVTAVNTVVLASDVINNNAIANSMQDITGLSFPVIAGETYQFEFFIAYQAAALTTGSRFSINGPAFSLLGYNSQYALTTTTNSINNAATYDQPATSSTATPIAAGNLAWLSGIITPSADGNVIARFASEVTSSAITAKAGSICKWIRTL